MERIWTAEMSKLDSKGNIVSAGVVNIRQQVPEGTTEMKAEHDRGGDQRERGTALSKQRTEERTYKSPQSEISYESKGSDPTAAC